MISTINKNRIYTAVLLILCLFLLSQLFQKCENEKLQLEEIELEQTKTELTDRRTAILAEWKDIQKLEEGLLNNLATKYGDGSLNLKDGTFKPAPKQQ